MSEVVRTLGQEACPPESFHQRVLYLRTPCTAWGGGLCTFCIRNMRLSPAPSPKGRLPDVGSQPYACTSTSWGQEVGGVPFGENGQHERKDPQSPASCGTWPMLVTHREAHQPPCPSSHTESPLAFQCFLLNMSRKIRVTLPLNKIPSMRVIPKQTSR